MPAASNPLMGVQASIFGCLGPELSQSERAFFNVAQPWGFILFARNIVNPDQTRALCDQLRSAVNRDAPILIDQEGGRVQRLTPPHWREWIPPMDETKRVDPDQRARAIWLRYRIIASELHALGIDVNCAPMLDVPTADAHPVIYNRCYGDSAQQVATLGRAVSDALLAGGVLPIIKHIPGHGRGSADSHTELPIVNASAEELQRDCAPFRALADLPIAMSAHVLYPAWDAHLPATLSPFIINLIRNDIGFDGLLISDDISMQALQGSYQTRSRNALDAGCDMILHCNGDPDEMEAIAHTAPQLKGDALRRALAAQQMRNNLQEFDIEHGVAAYNRLLKGTN